MDTPKLIKDAETALGVLQSLDQGIVVIEAQTLKVTYCNANAARILNLTIEQLKGQGPADPDWRTIHMDGSSFPPETHPAMHTLRTGQPQRNVVMGVYSSSAPLRWIQLNTQPIFRPGETLPHAVVNSFTDITESLRAREVVQHLYELAPVVFATISFNGKLLDFNPALQNLLGLSAEQMRSSSVLDLVHPDDRDLTAREMRKIQDGEKAEYFENRLRRGDGDWVWIAWSGVSVHGEPALHAMGRDITPRKKVEEELRRSEERLALALEASEVGIWDWNVAANTLTWSEELKHLFGIAPEDFNGSFEQFISLVHPLDREQLMQTIDRAMRTGKSYEIEHRVAMKDGGIRWLLGKGRAYLDSSGAPVRMSGTTVDITAHKSNEELYRFAFNQIPAVIATFKGPEHLFRTINTTGRQAIPDPDPIGKPLSESLAPALARELLPFFDRVYQTGETFRASEVPLQITPRDGEEETKYYNLTLAPMRDSGERVTGIFDFAYDVTEHVKSRKQVEETARQLQQARDELEQRVLERTAALTASNQELEAFSYSVSHDLRAPLRGIDGFSLALLEDYGGKLDDRAQKYLNFIREGVQRMGNLIDDLLKHSRLSRQELQKSEVDLSKIANSVANILRTENPERDVSFEIQPGLHVMGDSGLLQIVLENLLENAWKFTAHTPHAKIEFGARMDQGRCVFFIRDNGAGFDMAYYGKLFGAFQRLHSPNEGYKGTGIGLATVRRIIHRHGGAVWAEAKVGQGASFYFSL